MSKLVIIAVDGHSSCGKSTYAKKIAARYNLLYVDSGAMYRATTLFALRNSLIEENDLKISDVEKILEGINIDFRKNQTTGGNETYLNGENVEEEIRGMEVSNHVSLVSKHPAIREKMVMLQREMGRKKSIIMDGRDIGTVVFPDADIKIFLTASAEVRAKRRYDELLSKGINISYGEVLENVMSRDRIDETRDVAPLKKADDAFVLDNSNLSVEEQMEWFVTNFGSNLS